MLVKETAGWVWEQPFCQSTALVFPPCLCSSQVSSAVRDHYPPACPGTSALPLSLHYLSSNPPACMFMQISSVFCFAITCFIEVYMPPTSSKAIVLFPPMWETEIMVNGLNIFFKRTLPIMARLYKEAVTTKACSLSEYASWLELDCEPSHLTGSWEKGGTTDQLSCV